MATSHHPFLFKRSNGIWYIVFTQDGRRRWKSTECTDKKEARKQLNEFKRLAKPTRRQTTLADFREEFLPYARTNYASSTLNIFRRALDHLQQAANTCGLNSLTPRHLDICKTRRLNQVGPITVNMEMRALRAIFNVALRWGLLETNPFAKVQLARVPETAPSYFSKSEFQKLLDTIKEAWFKEVIFAVATGQGGGRSSTCAGSRWTWSAGSWLSKAHRASESKRADGGWFR